MIARIGIDPGLSGAIVVYNPDADMPLKWGAMPTMTVGSSNRVNAAALVELLEGWPGAHVFVERVGAMPGQGVTSMFNFGHATGTVMGVVAAMRIPHTLIAPATWKQRAGLLGQDKDAARARAIQLWPAWRELDTKTRGQALADAVLIARFAEALPEVTSKRRRITL